MSYFPVLYFIHKAWTHPPWRQVFLLVISRSHRQDAHVTPRPRHHKQSVYTNQLECKITALYLITNKRNRFGAHKLKNYQFMTEYGWQASEIVPH